MKTMKTSVPLVLLAGLLAIAPGASAQTRASATTRDIDRLQDALANLDESLADLDPEHPRTGEFQERAADIREDLVWLKVQMRRHQQSGNSGLGTSRADVESIRKSIVDLQADVDSALRRASGRPNELTLEEGTEIQVRLLDRVTSATARPEDRIEATVAVPVRNRGVVAIPAGTRVLGVVKQAERGQRPSKAGKLELAFHAIYLDDRTRTDIRTRVVELKQDIDRGDQAKKAGIGAVLGGVLAKTGEDVVLPSGTIITLSLDRSLTVEPDATQPPASGR